MKEKKENLNKEKQEMLCLILTLSVYGSFPCHQSDTIK
jgi:hypothetical protein